MSLKGTGILSNMINAISRNIEKMFRIFVPGFLLLFIQNYQIDLNTTISNLNNKNIILLILLSFIFGMIVYALHRTLFYVVDLLSFKFNIKEYSEYFKQRYRINNSQDVDFEKISQTLTFSAAIIHSAAMFFELMIYYCALKGITENIVLFIASILLLIVVVIIQIITINICKNIYNKV